MNEFTTELT